MPTKRMPLRGKVLMRRCCSPLSPIALRAALMRVISAEFRDDTPAPDGGDKIVLADHALAIADHVVQQIEHLGCKRNERRSRDLARAGPYRAHSPQIDSASRRSAASIARGQPSTAEEATNQDAR